MVCGMKITQLTPSKGKRLKISGWSGLGRAKARVFLLFVILVVRVAFSSSLVWAQDHGTWECWYWDVTEECRLRDFCNPGFIPPPGACVTDDEFVCDEQMGGECVDETGPLLSPTPFPTPNLTPGAYTACCGDNQEYRPFYCGGSDVPNKCRDINTGICHPDRCGADEVCQNVSGIDVCVGVVDGEKVAPFDPTCNGGKGINTALGCLPTDPQAFIDKLLPWAIGLGGGIAFLLMLYGVLLIIISAGNPEKMQAGKELITSAILGLVVIIFAVFIMRFIGVDILGLFG